MWEAPGLADGEKAPRYIALATTTEGDLTAFVFHDRLITAQEIAETCIRRLPNTKEIMILSVSPVAVIFPEQEIPAVKGKAIICD